MSELTQRLNKIQTELSVPKGQMNKFGGYKYRSCEDILEAIKPLLKKHELVLNITDQIEVIGDRYYVKANAMIIYENEQIVVSGYAREPESRKGMDPSQITGATSSYARKYALNGLFCIDDNKDPDATNKHGKEEVKKETKAFRIINEEEYKELRKVTVDNGWSFDDVKALCKSLGYDKVKDLNESDYQYVLTTFSSAKGEDNNDTE